MQRQVLFCMVLATLLLFSSELSAQTWTPQQSGSVGDIRDIAFRDDNNGIAAVWVTPGSAEILMTSDGGASWTITFSGSNQGMTGATFVNSSSPVVVGGTFNYGRVFRSFDNGSSWNQVFETPDVNPSFWCVDFPSATVGFAGGGNRSVFKSTDGGAGWRSAGGKVGTGAGQIVSLEFTSEQVGWAIASSADLDAINGRQLYRTEDGGRTWNYVKDFPSARQVYFIDATRGFVAGYDGRGPTVWRTTDGGERWIPTTLFVADRVYAHDVEFAPDNPYIGYVAAGNVFYGTSGALAATADGGITWTTEKRDIPAAMVAVAVPSQRSIYASGTGGAMYRSTREAVPMPVPSGSTDVTALDFDTLHVGEFSRASFNVRSQTVAGLRVDSITFSDPDPTARGLTVKTDRPIPAILVGIDSIEVSLRVIPTDTGAIAGVLQVWTNDSERPRFDVAYQAIVLPEPVTVLPGANLNRSAIAFDSVAIGDTAFTSFTITPANEAGLEVSWIEVLTGHSDFDLTTSREFPVELAFGEVLEVQILFAPTSQGELTGTVSVETNDEAEPVRMLGVTAFGLQPPPPPDTTGSDTGTTSVRAPGESVVTRLLPNPTRERVGVDMMLTRRGAVSIYVFDTRGRLVASEAIPSVDQGRFQTTIELPRGLVGVHLLEVKVDGLRISTERLILAP